MEQWKQIVVDGVAYHYEISSWGNVRRNNKIIKPVVINSGYLQVQLLKNGKRHVFLVHRLVALMFIPNDDTNKTEVDHIDKNRQNNRVENLRWLAHKNNTQHSLNKKVRCVETGQVFDSMEQACEKFGLKKSNLCNCCKKKSGYKTCGGYHWEYVDSVD